MSLIILLAIYPIRRRVYELFLFLHIVGGILFLYFCFQHLKLSEVRAFDPWLWACIGCWSFDRLARFWRIIRCNTRNGHVAKHLAKIKVINKTNIMKISIYPNKDGVGFFPGAHYFLYFGASWKFWQSHPFTAVDWRPKKELVNNNPKARHVKQLERERRITTATSMNDPARLGTAGSSGSGDRVRTDGSYDPNPFYFPDIHESSEGSDDEWDKQAVVDDDPESGDEARWRLGRAKITFLVRPHKGITQTIWNRIAEKSKKSTGFDKFGNRIVDLADLKGINLNITCLIEGPYGHQHSLHTYDTVVMIGGGIGVSTTLAYLYDHMARAEKRETFTRRFVFVWSCREDMLMNRLIWDADLMNKTRDCSRFYGTEIVMMLYFTGTSTKKTTELKAIEPQVREISPEKGTRRDGERDRDNGRRPSTARRNSKPTPLTIQSPPPAYYPRSPPEKDTSCPPRRSHSTRTAPEKSEKPGTSSSHPPPKRSQSVRTPPEKGENLESPKRSASYRAIVEKSEKHTQMSSPIAPLPPKRRESHKSSRGKEKDREPEKRRRNHEKPQPEPELQFQLTPPKPARKPSTKSTHTKNKDESPKDRNGHPTRPPLHLRIGRPDISAIIEEENRMLTGKMAVLACGPDRMVDATREAVVKCVGKDAAEGARIQYFEEAFGW